MKEIFYQTWQQFRDFSRLKVFGGWIVYSSSLDDAGITTAESMVYVPDPEHKWSIDSIDNLD